ncbi:hypothetical protein [Nonomuraea fuscirosea]|uniref:hypothetical protein n=1 Tax=Nonomuraea fuscirosea TaxID=1291556 RepID=UPI00343541E0
MKILTVIAAGALTLLFTSAAPVDARSLKRPALCSVTSLAVGELVDSCRLVKSAGL